MSDSSQDPRLKDIELSHNVTRIAERSFWDFAVNERWQESSSDQQIAPTTVWLDGQVLMCACPECLAPLSIRFWLMTADCWRCQSSVVLSEQQEEQARQLLETKHTTDENAVVRSRSQNDLQQIRKRAVGDRERRQPVESQEDDFSNHRQESTVAGQKRKSVVQGRSVALHSGFQSRNLQNWLSDLPAWLISALIHLALLTLLALWMIEQNSDFETIVLSTEVSRHRIEGGFEEDWDPEFDVAFELPVPPGDRPKNENQRRAILAANQDARELRVDPNSYQPQLPPLHQVKSSVVTSQGKINSLVARDPRIRAEIVRREGGTTLTEAAVARGLRWMANHQEIDGCWRLDAFPGAAACGGRCDFGGQLRSDTAGTALVLLPFLGAGQTHLAGRYKDSVSAGIRWLVQQQKEDGDLRGQSAGNSGMYAQGQATIVLCEAFAMTGDESIREAAQKGIDFIVAAQHPAGGWRYHPQQVGDTSVLGWQLMALQSGRAAQLNVSEETLELASHFLDSVGSKDGSRYAYLRGQGETHVMTAEALLCRMYLGWTFDDPGLRLGLEFLMDQHLPNDKQFDLYYWYYATQVMHHAGGAVWDTWNRRLRDILVKTQETSGHVAGSWKPRSSHDQSGGRLYVTSLAVCTLEVYYRHAPIFHQIQLD